MIKNLERIKNVTGIWGNVTGISGNINACEITDEERKKGIDIDDLVKLKEQIL